MTRTTVLFLNLVLFSLFYLTALDSRADHPGNKLSIADGLPDVVVFAVEKDRDGYLWFGTLGGVSRYNGYELKTLSHHPADPESLSNNSVSSMLIDRMGFVWAATWGGGLNRINPVTFEVKRYLHDEDDATSLSANHVQTIFEDHNGIIWVGTATGGLNRLERDSNSFTRFTTEDGLSHNRIWSIAESENGTLWIGTTNGLNRFDTQTNTFKHYEADRQNENALPHAQIRAIHYDVYGKLLLGTKGGLSIMDIEAESFRTARIDKGNTLEKYLGTINSFKKDGNTGVIWVGTESGILAYNPKSEIFVNLPYQTESESLTSRRVRDIEIDENGVLWLATRGGGVIEVNLKASMFKKMTEGFFVTSVMSEDEEVFWAGTYQGLYKGDIKLPEKPMERIDDVEGNIISTVYSVGRAPDGRKWVATVNGLYRSDSAGELVLIPGTYDEEYRSILFGKNKVWVGSSQGLISVDYSGENYAVFAAEDPLMKELYSRDEVFNSLMETREGELLGGTKYGNIYKIDRERQSLSFMTKVSESSIFTMAQTQAGEIWLGVNEGLFSFDTSSGVLTHYDELNNLKGKAVTGIIVDNETIWLATRNGLSSFDIVERRFFNFGIADGLSVSAFSPNAYTRDSKGRIYLGSQNGIVWFDPAQLYINQSTPLIRLDDIVVNHKTIIPERITSGRYRLELDHKDKFFSVSFSLKDMSSPEVNQYRYKLVGFDDEWTYAGRGRIAMYTNIDPGTYAFFAEGSNRAGKWSNEPLMIDIQIHPPWWKTWYARIGGALMLLLLSIMFHQVRIKRYKIEQRRLEHRVAQRTQELENANKQLKEISSQDFLTQLMNRRAFLDRATEEIARVQRNDGCFCIALIDIDDFKKINDMYGHEAGDKVLVSVARLFNTLTRKQDQVARWGGEEFIFLLPDTNMAQSLIAFEKIRSAIEKMSFVFKGSSIKVTATFGVAEYTAGTTIEQCVSSADQALYEGKSDGKNKVVSAA